MPSAPPTVALLGGTGRSGPGLALRLGLRGVRVLIGSRDSERGAAAAGAVATRLAALDPEGAGQVTGHGNAAAAAAAEIAFLTVPHQGMADLLCEPELAEALRGRIVVSTVVPMSWSRELGPAAIELSEGSAAEQAASLLPGARVVAGFHSLSSTILARAERAVDSDVVITGDDAGAKRSAMDLAELLPGVRAVDGGPLRYARQSEQLTVLLLSINRVNRCHAGVVITDLPPR